MTPRSRPLLPKHGHRPTNAHLAAALHRQRAQPREPPDSRQPPGAQLGAAGAADAEGGEAGQALERLGQRRVVHRAGQPREVEAFQRRERAAGRVVGGECGARAGRAVPEGRSAAAAAGGVATASAAAAAVAVATAQRVAMQPWHAHPGTRCNEEGDRDDLTLSRAWRSPRQALRSAAASSCCGRHAETPSTMSTMDSTLTGLAMTGALVKGQSVPLGRGDRREGQARIDLNKRLIPNRKVFSRVRRLEQLPRSEWGATTAFGAVGAEGAGIISLTPSLSPQNCCQISARKTHAPARARPCVRPAGPPHRRSVPGLQSRRQRSVERVRSGRAGRARLAAPPHAQRAPLRPRAALPHAKGAARPGIPARRSADGEVRRWDLEERRPSLARRLHPADAGVLQLSLAQLPGGESLVTWVPRGCPGAPGMIAGAASSALGAWQTPGVAARAVHRPRSAQAG
jgi:hypothetical protein